MNLSEISKDLMDVCVFEMEHSGYKAKIMEAERLEDNGSEHGLPPGNAMRVIPIHCLPACPDSWVKESGSYIIPIEVDKGIWFDWTMNNRSSGVVPSIKGMNPITGRKIEEIQPTDLGQKNKQETQTTKLRQETQTTDLQET